MKKILFLLTASLILLTTCYCQVEPAAGTWKTWFIPSGKAFRMPAPASWKGEIAQVVAVQKQLDSADMQQILFWNAGSPGYRWQIMMDKLWMNDTGSVGALANLLLGVATYDATVAAW